MQHGLRQGVRVFLKMISLKRKVLGSHLAFLNNFPRDLSFWPCAKLTLRDPELYAF